LIVSGASVNATCDEGESALSVCCKLKHFAEALLLIEHGANLDIRNKQGRSLVQLATITWTLYEE
jgi:ankyrin repeat protein